MKYTVKQEGQKDRVYEGFENVVVKVAEVEVLAVVTFDGEQDLYKVDPDQAMLAQGEIVRMYQDDFGRAPESLVLFARISK